MWATGSWVGSGCPREAGAESLRRDRVSPGADTGRSDGRLSRSIDTIALLCQDLNGKSSGLHFAQTLVAPLLL